MSNTTPRAVTIASGASSTPAITLDGTIVGIEMPAAWTAADLAFQGSSDGVNFFDIYDDASNQRLVQVAASHYIAITTSELLGLNYLKILSIAAGGGAAVNQAADRTLKLYFRRIS